MKEVKYSTVEILKGINEGDDRVLRFIYKSYYEIVEKMVIEKNGTADMAKDIFQEALVILYKKTQSETFEIKQSSFFTYLFAVCKNLLFNYYKNSKKDMVYGAVELKNYHDISEDLAEEERMIKDGLKEHLFHKYLKKIPSTCIKILQLVLKGFKASVIAKRLQLSGESYVRKRKTICLKTLIEMINNDPISKELL